MAALGFGLPGAARYDRLPSVTYCEPELAQVGLTEAAAKARHRRGRAAAVRAGGDPVGAAAGLGTAPRLNPLQVAQ